MADKELKDQRIPIMMSGSELSAIDDWAFGNRIRSRGEAIRRLCQIGLIFDGHRSELIQLFRGAMEATGEATKAGAEIMKQGSMSEAEKQVIAKILEAMMATIKLAPLIRTTTGLANNFKSERDIEDIIAEAKQILADDSDEDKPSG